MQFCVSPIFNGLVRKVISHFQSSNRNKSMTHIPRDNVNILRESLNSLFIFSGNMGIYCSSTTLLQVRQMQSKIQLLAPSELCKSKCLSVGLSICLSIRIKVDKMCPNQLISSNHLIISIQVVSLISKNHLIIFLADQLIS